MASFLSKFFGGSKSEKDVKVIFPTVKQINQFYEQFRSLSNDELRNKTQEFRIRIKEHLKEIDEAEYLKTLLKLTTAKWNNLASEQYLNRQAKTHAYLLQKGFEPALISQAIQQVRTENK